MKVEEARNTGRFRDKIDEGFVVHRLSSDLQTSEVERARVVGQS